MKNQEKLKRYDSEYIDAHECLCHKAGVWTSISESEDGDYVSYEDYQNRAQRIAELEEIVSAVGYIGIDFGYGQYTIDQKTIEKARQLTTKGGE